VDNLPLIDVGFGSGHRLEIPNTEFAAAQNNYFLKNLDRWIKASGAPQDRNRIINMFHYNLYLMQHHFTPVDSDYDDSLDAWLEKTTYTQADKERLRQTIVDDPVLTKKHLKCKCFVKAESYPEYKPLRPIKSRTDRFKAEVGPKFHAVNEVLFKHPEFIKKIPVNERPAYIKNLLGWAQKFSCTDFSKYESHFVQLILNTIEIPFYDFCVHKIPTGKSFIKLIRNAMTSPQQFVFKFFTSTMNATRASGEMCTSSGNGYTNFFLFHYISECRGAMKATGVFEGDDGLTTTMPVSSMPTSNDYAYLGFNCKMETVGCFSHASFCGLVADEDELINVCDIRKTICDLGWTCDPYVDANENTLLALLRAKGFSLVYQYPGCPVLDALGHHILRLTDEPTIIAKFNKINMKVRDQYKFELLQNAIAYVRDKRPQRISAGMKTRVLVEHLYGVAVSQQLRIEEYFDTQTVLAPFHFEMNVPDLWIDNFHSYTRPTKEFHYLNEPHSLLDNIEKFSRFGIRQAWNL